MSISTNTEQLFLKISKIVVISLMGLSLVLSLVALVAGAWFMAAVPKQPQAAKAAPKNEVSIDDFFKQLDKEVPKQEEKKAEPPAEKAVPAKYLEETRKILSCVTESNSASKVNSAPFSNDAVDDFRKDLQRVADASSGRGQPYVTDAVRVICAIMLHEKVVAFRVKNSEARVFIPAVNFHLGKWDELKAATLQFVANEDQRVLREERAEESRVDEVRSKGKNILLAAAAAFGLFMTIALYLIIAAIESHMRRISSVLQETVSQKRNLAND